MSSIGIIVKYSETEGAPALVRWTGVENLFGVLMPIRGDDFHTDPTPSFSTAAPYRVPVIEFEEPKHNRYYIHDSYSIEIAARRSNIDTQKPRRFCFESAAQARRVYNRLLSNRHAVGQMLDKLPLPRELAPFEKVRADNEAMQFAEMDAAQKRTMAASKTFESTTDADLKQPWKRSNINSSCEHRKELACSALPAISEGAHLASTYATAA